MDARILQIKITCPRSKGAEKRLMSINHVRLYFQAVYVDCKDFLIGKKKKRRRRIFLDSVSPTMIKSLTIVV